MTNRREAVFLCIKLAESPLTKTLNPVEDPHQGVRDIANVK